MPTTEPLTEVKLPGEKPKPTVADVVVHLNRIEAMLIYVMSRTGAMPQLGAFAMNEPGQAFGRAMSEQGHAQRIVQQALTELPPPPE